jgi:optic atrophy protein 1
VIASSNNIISIPQINCSDVVLFWRIQQVIKVTANALRQQVVNREARRVDKEIKEVLGECRTRR